jgi:RNA polymerase sigma-70 factor (ECF subfamily)
MGAKNRPPKKKTDGRASSFVSQIVKADIAMNSSASPQEIPAEPLSWLAQFHAGSREILRECYVDHFASVERTVGRILKGADKETVIHEIFFRLITNERLRLTFQGGSFRAWVSTIARNQAVDYWRRQQFEVPAGAPEDILGEREDAARFENRVEAQITIDRFRTECLPEKWRKVFDARFIQQLDQPEAARVLGMHRTTLIYQEYCVRNLLKRFVLRKGKSR